MLLIEFNYNTLIKNLGIIRRVDVSLYILYFYIGWVKNELR